MPSLAEAFVLIEQAQEEAAVLFFLEDLRHEICLCHFREFTVTSGNADLDISLDELPARAHRLVSEACIYPTAPVVVRLRLKCLFCK